LSVPEIDQTEPTVGDPQLSHNIADVELKLIVSWDDPFSNITFAFEGCARCFQATVAVIFEELVDEVFEVLWVRRGLGSELEELREIAGEESEWY
jgi:hypothetical protein